MLKRSYRFILLLMCCFGPLVISTAWSAEKPKESTAPKIEPQAAQILKKMSDYLKGLKQFSVTADITEDVLLDSGITIQDGRTATASVRRPNRLRINSSGDVDDRQTFYNGKTLTILDQKNNTYSTIDVPPKLDAAIDYAIQTYNLRAPFADLIYSDPYDDLTEGTLAGYDLGLSKVQGVTCHHLVFKQKDIDWQIWIEDGPTPLPRKFLITDKKAKGLQFTALFSQWNTSPQLEDDLFDFVAPTTAEKVELRPVAPTGGPNKNIK